MGYEICYWYHERMPDGKWNTDERREMKKKIGGPTDEVELEKLAAIILTQLAKRDKLVVDVEVYEYAKKRISFKEASDSSGIVLKNKKFTAGTIAGQLMVEESDEPQPHENGNGKVLALPRNEDARRASNSGRVQAWMVFDPEIPLLHEAKQKGLKLTVGNKYAAYEIKPHPTGVGNVLTIMDDAGARMLVHDKYFVANTRVRLVGDEEVGGFSTKPGAADPRLSYESQVDSVAMPNLRPHIARSI
jgi:hypothetical protein